MIEWEYVNTTIDFSGNVKSKTFVSKVQGGCIVKSISRDVSGGDEVALSESMVFVPHDLVMPDIMAGVI